MSKNGIQKGSESCHSLFQFLPPPGLSSYETILSRLCLVNISHHHPPTYFLTWFNTMAGPVVVCPYCCIKTTRGHHQKGSLFFSSVVSSCLSSLFILLHYSSSSSSGYSLSCSLSILFSSLSSCVAKFFTVFSLGWFISFMQVSLSLSPSFGLLVSPFSWFILHSSLHSLFYSKDLFIEYIQ